MYVFSSKRTIQSKAVPGVEIVIRKMTESRRQELMLMTSDVNSRLTELYKTHRKLRDDNAPPPEIQKVSDDINALTKKELIPLQIQWGVAEIRGLALVGGDEDDQTIQASPDNSLNWPAELYDEVQVLLEKGNAITEPEAKN